jgi:hypothetical protein
MAVAFHLVLGGALAAGAAFDDPFARSLRTFGARVAVVAVVAVLAYRFAAPGTLPDWVARGYAPATALVMAGYGRALRHRPSNRSAALSLTAWLAAMGWPEYRILRQTVVGLDAIALGLVLLALAQAISLTKAGLLPAWVTRLWKKGYRALLE